MTRRHAATIRRSRQAAAAALGLLAICVSCASGAPRSVPDALRRGLAYLWAQQQPAGTWDTPYTLRNPGGVESLVALAALAGGQSPADPRLLKTISAANAADPQQTYPRAVRAMLYARLGKDYDARLTADVAWLVKGQLANGGWGYGPDHHQTKREPKWADISNTQLALLALFQASDAGKTVPQATWKKAAQYLLDAQQRDGGWAYTAPGVTVLRSSSFGSMTAAATVSLMSLSDRLPAKDRPEPKQVLRGVLWLENNFEVKRIPKWGWGDTEYWPYFYLFCLARAGDAVGWGAGDKDWRTPIVNQLLAVQNPDGSWTHPPAGEDKAKPVRTALALLALAHAARTPLVEELMLPAPNLGRHDGAVLAAVAAKRLGWPVTWQRARSGVPSHAPILYVVLDRPTVPEKETLESLQTSLDRGATLLVQCPPNDAGAVKRFRDFFLDAFIAQGFEAADLPDDHPLFWAAKRIPQNARPKLLGIGDSVRTPILLVTSDLRSALDAADPAALDFAENLILVATGGQFPPPPAAADRKTREPVEPVRSLRVARVVHAGGYAACGRAMSRLNGTLLDALTVGVTVGQPPVSLKKPVPEGIQLLWITGSRDPKFTAQECQNLAAFVRAGGTVFMDSTIGRDAFTQPALQMLRDTFGATSVSLLDGSSPLLTGRFGGGVGAEIGTVSLSQAALADKRRFELYGVKVDGRIGVVFCPLGVTPALESDRLFGAATLATDDALRLAANVALYALSGGK